MAYESAVMAGLEAQFSAGHASLNRIGIGRKAINGRELMLAERVELAVAELETLRRRVALLTHVERKPQLDDDHV